MLSVYSVAIGLGILSHVPGGAGVFETVILGALGTRLPLDGLVGALLLYRVIYYVMPLAVAVIALTIAEIRRAAAANAALARGTIALVPLVLSAFAVVLGAMLVFSGVTPTPDDKLDWLQSAFPLPVVEAGHFIASILGLLMILTGRGLVHRLDGAWWMTLVLAASSIAARLRQGLRGRRGGAARRAGRDAFAHPQHLQPAGLAHRGPADPRLVAVRRHHPRARAGDIVLRLQGGRLFARAVVAVRVHGDRSAQPSGSARSRPHRRARSRSGC